MQRCWRRTFLTREASARGVTPCAVDYDGASWKTRASLATPQEQQIAAPAGATVPFTMDAEQIEQADNFSRARVPELSAWGFACPRLAFAPLSCGQEERKGSSR